MKLLAKVGIGILNIIYIFYKLFPIKKQIVFLSRQSDKISIDYYMLKHKLKEIAPYINIIEIYEMIPASFTGKIKYGLNLVTRQMFALATSKVVILDGYSIAVSVLKHRKDLKIIQMWHAMGSLKCFGYATINSAEGYNKETAQVFRMHKNYDYILASSRNCIVPLSIAFGNPVDKFLVMSLPRIDIITDKKIKEQLRGRILKRYPHICQKRNILYAPTFRKNADMVNAIKDLIDSVDYEEFNLIIKLHPLMKEQINQGKAMIIEEFTSLELLSIADFVVTDYSAFIFEAAVAKIPIISYAFDYDVYEKERGFLIDFKKEIPTKICRTAEDVIEMINTDRFDLDRISRFAQKYVTYQEGCTQRFAKFVLTVYNEENINMTEFRKEDISVY